MTTTWLTECHCLQDEPRRLVDTSVGGRICALLVHASVVAAGNRHARARLCAAAPSGGSMYTRIHAKQTKKKNDSLPCQVRVSLCVCVQRSTTWRRWDDFVSGCDRKVPVVPISRFKLAGTAAVQRVPFTHVFFCFVQIKCHLVHLCIILIHEAFCRTILVRNWKNRKNRKNENSRKIHHDVSSEVTFFFRFCIGNDDASRYTTSDMIISIHVSLNVWSILRHIYMRPRYSSTCKHIPINRTSYFVYFFVYSSTRIHMLL